MHRLGSAVAALLLATAAEAGTVAAAGNSLGYTGALTDTFIVFGENQKYTDDPVGGPACANNTRCKDLMQQAQWICDHKADDNIKGVFGVGDMVRLPSDVTAWNNLAEALNILAACNVPYVPTVGNHEIDETGGPSAFVGEPDEAGDATNYWTYLGAAVDTKGWFAGRGNYEEVAGPGSLVTPVGDPLYTEANNTGSRSFWGRFGSRFAVMATEWEMAARIQFAGTSWSCGDTSATWSWAQSVMAANPNLIFFNLSHDGPCELDSGAGPITCATDWSDTIGGACSASSLWKTYRDDNENALVFLHGHTNRDGNFGLEGGGLFLNIARDSGTNALLGVMDMTDPARNYDPALSYGWSVRLRWKRAERKYCLQTIRTINASTNPATLIYQPDVDRAAYGNNAETCANMVLPSALR